MFDIVFNDFTFELIVRLLLSILLAGIVGFEREITGKPAGLRTHALVSMGACLFTISSFYLSPGAQSADMSRIAAGVVTGIGFIGAGSIIATRGHIKGITTAASLWLVASIGLTVGMGGYVIAFIASVFSFIILRMGSIEKEIEYEKKNIKETKQRDFL